MAALDHQVADPMAPLDAQMGVWPLLDVPADMEEALFGPIPDPGGGAPSQPPLYAVLEGARLPKLFDLIDDDAVPHAPLFQGEVAEALGEEVPVLVALERGHKLLRQLLTDLGDDDAPTGLLPREAAVFLRSGAGLAAVRGHLRHFTQLPDGEGRRIYFRFWEPASLAPYLDHIAGDPGQVAAWFCDPRAPVARVIIPGRTPDGWLLHQFAPVLPPDTPRTPVILDAPTREVLRLARYNANVLESVRLLLRTFPDALAGQPPRKLRSRIDRLYRKMIPLGFHGKQALFMLAAWEVHYGPDFESRDPEGHLARVLATPGREDDRLRSLRERLEALPPESLDPVVPEGAEA